MKPMTAARLRRAASLLVLLAAAACRSADAKPDVPRVTSAAVSGAQSMTHTEYMALPDSVRIDANHFESWQEAERGVAVQAGLMLNGQAGEDVPLAYWVYDARHDVPVQGRSFTIAADGPEWRREGYLWLPVREPGAYYARVVLGDTTGLLTSAARSQAVTVE